MIRPVMTGLTLGSVMLFPWPAAAVLALMSAVVEPLVPLAAGILADALYYVPQAHSYPLFTLFGMLVTLISSVVRSRLRPE